MIELAMRVACSLLVVFGLLWALAKLARRPLMARRSGMLTVLARQQLSRGSSVAVVRVADRALVLGVSDAGVSLLADADAELFVEQPAEPAVHRTPVALPAPSEGRLAGSVLSVRTWRQAVRFFRGGGAS